MTGITARWAALLLAILLIFSSFAFAEEEVPQLEVHFLNVERNDGILIRFGDQTAFIDGGGYHEDRKILAYFAANNVDHLDYYIATHGHLDHVGVAGAIFAAIPTERILMNHSLAIDAMLQDAHTQEERDLINSIPKTKVRKGNSFEIGEATLTCVGPDKIYHYTDCSDGRENGNSLIFRLTYGESSFVLTGDATTEVIEDLINEDPDFLDCSVLKSRHHNVGMHDLEFAVLKADYVVYSTSSTALPGESQINRCREAGAQVLITCDSNAGDVIFTTDGYTLKQTCTRPIGDWSLSYSRITVEVDEIRRVSRQLPRTAGSVDTMSYHSNNPAVAIVDPNGLKITGVSPGSCIITVTAYDGTTRAIRVNVVSK